MTFFTPLRIFLLILCLLLAIGAYILRFVLWGYSFSALVCCCLIGIILFYTFYPLAALHFPVAAKWAFRIFTLCLIIGILIVSVTEILVIKASFGTPHESVDYLLVLGAKVRVTGPSASLWDRIYAAEEYLKAHPDTIAIVSGGQGSDEPWPEADVMYTELVYLGIEPERIWVEDKATSTWENINFALELIEEKTGARPETLGILSSEYHLFRASLFAKECGVGFVGVPAATSRMGQTINHFMREVAGVWHFLLLGGKYA
ncbi:MAG: YdcF family protein [Oscillospiraceae bacterium]|nr:YdcF family protein [Oscillospiraceae bacterium]